MLFREGDDRNDTIDLWLACSLAIIAGALNAAAFYAVGFFSANMTGNVSIVSDHLALEHWPKAIFYLGILLTFIGGSAASASLIDLGRGRTRRIYAHGILIEAIFLVGVGCADLSAPSGWRVPAVVLGLAFAMGFQNAIGTRISGARVRTTHISGLSTDIGIELAAAFASLCQRNGPQHGRHDFGKLRLQVSTVLSFLFGGVAGVLLYRAIGGLLQVSAATVLAGIALLALVRSRHAGLEAVAPVGD